MKIRLTFVCKFIFMREVFLLLGSNLGDRFKQIELAIDQIDQKVGFITAKSSVYETEPWGTDEPLPFLNMVIRVSTLLDPQQVLDRVLEIEKALGRQRSNFRNQPRTIDIDILLCGDSIISTKQLTVPHERMHLRRFVLEPLNEIAPSAIHPVFKKSVKVLLSECDDNSWVRRV